MGFEARICLFGPTDIGKSCLLEFITTGKRPNAASRTTAWYVPVSESLVFYRRDWERVSEKIYGKMESDFVNWMMRDATPADRPQIKKAHLRLCNRNANEEDKILDLDEAYTLVTFVGPDTGGQKKYEDILTNVAYSCKTKGHSIYPCFRNIPGNIDDLKVKMEKFKSELGQDYKWEGAYLQLQLDRDNKVPEEQIAELKKIQDLPVYPISSKEMGRYEIVDTLLIPSLKPFVTR